MHRLRKECDHAMRILSSEYETIIKVEKAFGGFDLKVSVTRQKFEELCVDLFEKCLIPLASAMQHANILINDISDVVITGGLHKAPILSKMLDEFFKGKEIKKPDNYHELSAFGAALEAGIVLGLGGKDFENLL